MRFTASAILALPLLAAAADSPFEEYKAKFQNFLSSFGAAPPSPSTQEAPADAGAAGSATVGAKNMEILTLDNWKDTLYSPVKPDATTPEEWWVLISGRNKTCFGHCLKVEEAFNETVAKFATIPNSPHVAYLNCDDQPVLCNAWSATTGALWIFEMLPPPAPVDVYWKRLNLTTTTAQTLLDFHAQDAKKNFHLIDGYFHPVDGLLAKNGLAVPLGYFFWVLNAIPSWGMMLVVSFISRAMMNRRMDPAANRPANAAAAAARGAPPGDAR
ncbi:hypothetical protein QBC46DRAFT_369784 [Diplogelasinospora grovesii]|uniref:Peptidyl-tRNA hydrolase n=1 Tax=Diplogelasinospora grovesii TaxID=303347 RepID=A0AAN6NJ13_9PEZI|nr:hypothetical protein QBC46DRAFT_369784 [Diplogelasinospora grovesii]